MSTILEEARELVHLHRNVEYGNVANEWARVGRMWGAILGTHEPIPAHKCQGEP